MTPHALSWDDDIQYVKGAGPQVTQKLQKLGIRSVRDLLWHIPRRHDDRTRIVPLNQVQPDVAMTVQGRVVTVDNQSTRRGMTITHCLIDDGTGTIDLIWFNQPYMRDQLKRNWNRTIVAYGTVQAGAYHWQMSTPEWEPADESGAPPGVVPVYPLTEGLAQSRMRALVQRVLTGYDGILTDPLPETLLQKRGLLPLRQALWAVHYPTSMDQVEAGRSSLAYRELLLLQLHLALQRADVDATPGVAFPIDPEGLRVELQRIAPFTLTHAQNRVISQIWQDMASPRPMQRLLQGDVGSGKTIVAAAAVLACVRGGYQAAIMAPTAILATQHWLVFNRLLQKMGWAIDLAVGSLGVRARKSLRNSIATGTSQVVVGTHALIEEDVQFARLGLVIIDEQHRFGVLQRATLRQKGQNPDTLVMTATPIPRTLTMSLFGDLDLSAIDEMPPGRTPVRTHWKQPQEREQVYQGVRTLMDAGRQVYWVCPLVSESEKLQARAATELAEHLRRDVFPGYCIGLLHGQMKPSEKDSIMEQFRQGQIQLLVSTTVIEVGVDVPNASVMVVEDAERFGLAQLHQLRGRVGRGGQQSYCVLISEGRTENARARLGILTETSDGFRVAEEDLRLRGPGEMWGVRQSGAPQLQVADLLRDGVLLREAREDAQELVAADVRLERHPLLLEDLERRRAAALLATVG